MKRLLSLALIVLLLSSFVKIGKKLNPAAELDYCSAQVQKTLSSLSAYNRMPLHLQLSVPHS